MKRNRLMTIILLALISISTSSVPTHALLQTNQTDPSRLTLDTIFTYAPRALGEIQWQADGSGYFMLEPSATSNGALDLVRYDVTTGGKTTLVSAEKLKPAGATSPIVIEQFDFSADGQKLLIFTNSERVWRSNT